MRASQTGVISLDCEVLIVGGGPAGLSAATVLGRCLRNVLIYDNAEPRNSSSRAMHCFLSRDGVDPKEFLAIARRELDRYATVSFYSGVARSARAIAGGFEVTFDGGVTRTAQKLLLATGVKDVLPDIARVSEFYGRSVHHCPYCDAWEHRGRAIAVIGDGDKGVGLAKLMRQWSAEVTLCVNGGLLTPNVEASLEAIGVRWRNERVIRCEGADGQLQALTLESGPPLACHALFFNTGQSQGSELLKMLGCGIDAKGGVECDDKEETCVPGLFVAGDASRDLQFVIMAAAEGAKVAVAINAALCDEAIAA